MANKNDNLLKGNEKHTFTPEELSKGGKASAEARRKKRDLRQAIEILLDTDIKGKNGDIIYKYNKDVTFEPCMGLNKEEVIKTRV